jgi:tetratricopeptide (TPR) repeat protein
MTDRRYVAGVVAGALMGLAFGVPGGYALQEAGDHSAAPGALVPALPRALVPREANLVSLIDEGRQAQRNGQPERALSKALEAERLAPGDANVKNNLCVYLGDLSRYDEAILACNAALRLQPDFRLARNNLDWMLAQRSRASVRASSTP